MKNKIRKAGVCVSIDRFGGLIFSFCTNKTEILKIWIILLNLLFISPTCAYENFWSSILKHRRYVLVWLLVQLGGTNLWKEIDSSQTPKKPYLLLHFSANFSKQGLKWKNKSISKISPAGMLNLNLVFLKLDSEILKMMSCNKLCWKFIKNLFPPSFLNRFQQTRSQMKEQVNI